MDQNRPLLIILSPLLVQFPRRPAGINRSALFPLALDLDANLSDGIRLHFSPGTRSPAAKYVGGPASGDLLAMDTKPTVGLVSIGQLAGWLKPSGELTALAPQVAAVAVEGRRRRSTSMG